MMMSFYYPAIFILLLQNGYITDSATWSPGTYALLKPKSGCPTGWETEGSINHITGNNNDKSNTLHMQGDVNDTNILTRFCIKTIDSNTGYRSWSKGQYCIYGDLLYWQSQGYIWMYESTSRDNLKNVSSFAYLDSNWPWYVELRFFCPLSGRKKNPISLPITEPFYLLPYGSRDCQQVQWMVATSEWIKYHTWNYDGYSYHQKYGTVPYHEVGEDYSDTGITMYYCYYKSCNHTLKNTSGVFQSPGFPGKYPDGQLCSWTIMVPDNHTLVVNFTQFSLYEYDKDCLQLYEYDTTSFKPKQAFFGHQQPFTITATSHLMFVFRSDEESKSTGFRAEYEKFKIPERTTTSKPLTTTSPPTTTTQTTTKLTTTQPPTTKQPTTNLPTTTEATTFPNVNWTTNETVKCNPIPTKNKSYVKRHVYPLREKTCFCDETWRIVVMVIPLAVFLLTVFVIIDIICRCRYKKALNSGAKESSADDGMVVNPTYERGNIILDQPADTSLTDTSTVNTVDEQPQSRDEPPDYEDVDYTQVDEVPPPRRSMKRQECHVLQPVGNDTSAVFYHVLERPESQDQPQIHVPGPVGNGTRHTLQLELLTESGRPTYQNLSELNHYTLNPLYEAAENSPPLVEANRLYDNYIA